MKKQDIDSNEELRTLSIRINSTKLNKKILSFVHSYRHFENILLILIKQNYDLYSQGQDSSNDFRYLTNKQTLRNALLDYKSKNSKDPDRLNEKYKDSELWQSLKETAKTIKQHNFVYIIDRVKSNYKTYFANLRLWHENPSLFTGMPKPPRPKKLSKLTNYAVDIDKYNALSFAKLENKNLIGVNLSNKMFYIKCSFAQIKKLTDIDKLHSAKIVYDNGLLYLNISYLKNTTDVTSLTVKESGIDIGVNNLAAVFVNDKTTHSLIVDGKPFKYYNTKFNRLLSKLNESKSCEVLEWGISKTGAKYPVKYTQKGKDINKFISFLYSKRNKYFYDQFHKVSKRIIEFLSLNNATELYLSKNLAELKNNGECNLRKTVKQNFIQIPFVKLLKNIEYKAQELGINVYWIDESYSSKSSCISDDIINIQLNQPKSTNAFNGKRVKRGLFLDTLLNKVFNADINGAVNHIKIATAKNFEWLKNSLFKLSNPIKIKSDYEFCNFLKILQNSVSGKSALQSAEASVSAV